MRRIKASALTCCFLALAPGGATSRAGLQSALEPAGPQAGHIHTLWQQLFWACCGVFLLVMGALVIALLKRQSTPDKEELPPATRRRVGRVISAAVGATALVLAFFLGATLVAEGRLMALETVNPLTLKITGKQWWWDVIYEDATAANTVQTANEVHIPVGRPVHLRLFASDVIHSLWAPSLHGKRDLIPGRETSLWIQADRAGEYEGQCAEFCGQQHAHMRLLVIAEPEADFQQWITAQRGSAAEPSTDEQRRGRGVFLGGTCVMCHAVRGTPAGSRAGPDLTHLASRRTLGSATIPNTRGYLAGWILDPQRIKPGNHMPPHAFAAEDLRALLDYLESLK